LNDGVIPKTARSHQRGEGSGVERIRFGFTLSAPDHSLGKCIGILEI
jgi:hypothetical protein